MTPYDVMILAAVGRILIIRALGRLTPVEFEAIMTTPVASAA